MSIRSSKVLVVVLGALLASTTFMTTELEASDGLCHRMCQRAFASCMWEAGCRPANCRDGSTCTHGRCADGTTCGAVGCDAAPCFEAQRECLDGCVDWIFDLGIPSFVDTLEIDPLIRNLLKERLSQVVLEVERGVAETRVVGSKELAAFKAEVNGLMEKQQVDPVTAWTLAMAADEAHEMLSAASFCQVESGKSLLRPVHQEPDQPEEMAKGQQ